MAKDQLAVSKNYNALKKKSYDIKFELEGTPYDAIENIGSGTYGVVCSAVQRITKKHVAIKKIASIYEQPIIAKRTYREIKILKHFNHDNIIAIRDIFRPKGPVDKFKDVYIVFDLMESDLNRIIHSRQDLSNEHVRYFLYQLLRGLKYVHSANVLHRDLKPSNLFVNENCELKLGDFGMARGVSSSEDSHNHAMTQYVATRWYRAPELMLLPLEYSGAVDIWSVGCIFAEMISRKYLFKGQNLVDQLRLIFDVLGMPSDEFLTLTKSDHLIKPFLMGMGSKKPVPMETLFPRATQPARDLLSKMLVIDPRHRVSVNEALKHPYLSRYHDPNDEPICVPVFDFQFEKEELTSAQLKEVILAEIRQFETTVTKKPTFDLRRVQKSASVAPLAATGLEAFLQKQQKGSQKDASSSRCSGTGLKPILLDAPKSAAADIEMLSGKLLELGLGEPSEDILRIQNTGALRVSAGEETLVLDVDMLSAKCAQVAVQEVAVPASTNSKALIKAAILKARQQQADGVENKEANRLVTAVQRQREREDRRRKKLNKRKQKRIKEKAATGEGVGLTADDINMLERWRSMQQQTTIPQCICDVSATPNHTYTACTTVPCEASQTTTNQKKTGTYGAAVSDVFATPETANLEATWSSDRPPSGVTCQPAWLPAYSQYCDVTPSILTPAYVSSRPARSWCPAETSFEAGTDDALLYDMCKDSAGFAPHQHNQRLQQQALLPSTLTSANNTDRLTVVTRSNIDEMTLLHTPKGSGDGYGIGLDLSAFLRGTQSSTPRLDSAPLSASLIADWLELSGNVDINDEAVQRELDMSPTVIPNLLI